VHEQQAVEANFGHVQLGRELPGGGTVGHARGLQREGVLGELIELAHAASIGQVQQQ
jgi:hypothetical protein